MTQEDRSSEGGSLRIVFDYVDPGSYLAFALLHRALQSGAKAPRADWVPLEIRPPTAPRQNPASPEWTGLTRTVEALAAEAGVRFRAPTFVPWTRKAHELAHLAAEKGCFEPVHQTLFEAHFVRGVDIGRVDVLAGLGEECGLDPAEVRTVLGVDRFGPKIDQLRAALFREEVRGVPLLQSNGKSLAGFQSVAELTAFFETI